MSTSQVADKIEFPGRTSPLTVFFVVVPILIIVLTGWVLMKYRLPIPLMGLLAIVAASCAVLVKSAAEHLGEISVELTAEEVIVKRVVGSASYGWSQIESVKVVAASPSFGDSGRGEEGRCGLGLFLRTAEKKERSASDPPDVMVVSRSGEDVGQLQKAAERLSNARRKAVSGGDTRRNTASRKPAKAFRRPAAA